MSADQTQKCPLCRHLATYEIFHDPYCKHFTCQVCGGFCIDEHSEIYLKTAPEDFHSKLSAKANATAEGNMFVMREPNEEEMKAQPHPKLTMIAETVNVGK